MAQLGDPAEILGGLEEEVRGSSKSESQNNHILLSS